MIVRIFKNFNKNKRNVFVEPDEIFLDSKNLENFDSQQFEGRIEKPIEKGTIAFVGAFFIFVAVLFSVKLHLLQIKKGEAYFERSENNNLNRDLLFADRGIIYDRNKVELAWNKKEEGEADFPTRTYLSPGYSHVLGYVTYPTKDKSGHYWQTEFTGIDGLEKQYDQVVRGENGMKIVETDVHGEIHSENISNAPVRGKELVTTIDSRLQSEMFRLISNLSESNSFKGGAGIIMDINTGEIITSTSYPEKDVYLDKTISGLYTPGSIVKPFFALGALKEGVIDPTTKILSTGSISIPNPYFPDQPSVFKDWKAHGWVDMRQALAVSSDVYFYEIGGGFEGQKGIGVANLEKYARLFGIGEKTGIDLPDEKSGTIPNPDWKAKVFKGEPWRVGDTYNTAIGQYGFQATPMEMARSVSAIANRGKLITPHFILGDKVMESKYKKIDMPDEYYNVVHEGMRQAVEYGTAVALNVPYVHAAAKTGTAQLGAEKNRVNSWAMGFFPYEDPKYAFVVMMESGPNVGGLGASSIMRGLFDWMSINTPEYFPDPA